MAVEKEAMMRLSTSTGKQLLSVFALMLALCALVLCGLPSERAHADELGDSFMVAAAGQDGTYLIEPVNVAYDEGDSVKDALERAGAGVEVDASGTVQSVAGVACESGSYLYYFTDYEGRESVLLGDVEAQSVKALFISSASIDAVGQSQVDVLELVRAYTLREDGLRNYPDATSAYERCLAGLPSASSDQAATLASDFADAIAAYDAIMAGEKRSITFKVTCDSAVCDDAQVTMTDVFGNATGAQRTGSGTYVAQVVDTYYSYEVLSADGLDGVRCTLMRVTGDETIEADIPVDEWYDSIELRVTSADGLVCPTGGTTASGRKSQVLRSIVPDAVNPTADLAVYATPAESISSQVNAYPLYAVYDGVDGESHVEQIAYTSSSFKPPYLVDSNAQGTSFTYEVRHPLDSTLLVHQIEICPALIERSPTLSALSVYEGETQLVGDFDAYADELDVYTVADELEFAPKAHGTAQEGYSVTVADTSADAGDAVSVDASGIAVGASARVDVVVSLDGKASNTYTVIVHKVEPVTVVLSHDADVSVQMLNDAVSAIGPSSQSSTSTSFELIEGRAYTYVATKGEYYHATCQFTARDGGSLSVATPQTVDVVQSFALGRDNLWGSGSTAKPLFELDETKSTLHDQYFTVPDSWSSQSWLRAYPASEADASSYTYQSTHARQDTGVTVKSSASSFVPTTSSDEVRISGSLPGFTTASGYANTATFTVTTGTDEASGATFTQDYYITVMRELTLPDMSVSDGLNACALRWAETADDEKPTLGFDRDVRDYVVVVAEGTSSVQVAVTFPTPVSAKALASGGYTVLAGDAQADYEAGATKTLEAPIDPTPGESIVNVIVRHEDPLAADSLYRITVRVMPKVAATFNTTPSDAAVTVIDSLTGLRVARGEDGAFALISGYAYSYTVAARGYVGRRASFTAEEGFSATVALEPVPDNPTVDPSITSYWPYFRADENNNAVVNVKTPLPASEGQDGSDNALLYWANRLGEGTNSGATGCPILVDGYLYSYGGDKIFKVDTITGETVASATMVGTSSFAITPMTYAEGMIFVALSNGRVEAFNASTLESLWVYTSPHGGQPNCPITYHDGCIYTGFWNWANVCDFVCLSVADEDPTTPGSDTVDDPDHPGQTTTAVLDAKVAIWELPHAGGFYWAGAWAGDDYVIVGSDNAAITGGLSTAKESDASGFLYSIDPYTGAVIDELSEYPGGVNVGNIRSTVVYDEQTGRFYYCGRGGYLCSVAVNADGTFDHDSVKTIRLVNSATDGVVSATSTPVVCDGRAYVGADHGTYNAYFGQSVDVVDLSTDTVAYTINMQGRPQTSALVTTAYAEEDGYVYVYFFDNYSPGKLRCFKDKPGQTHAVDAESETYTFSGKTTTFDNMASVVFCPQADQAEYCICSPIADEYGIMYFKNDSANMMALGPAMEKLEVVEPPTVTTYGVGETFDPTGMKVVVTYANGATRDVTDYVQCSTEEFTEEGTVEVPIEFPYTMYQSTSSDDDIGEAPDYNYPKPTTTVTVNVLANVAPQLVTTELEHAIATDAATGKQVPYEVTLSATGAPRTFTWTLTGDLPAGLAFDAATGTISGVAQTGSGGAYPIQVSVSNGVGSPATAQFTLEVYERPQITAPGSVLRAIPGVAFSYQVQATGYPQPLTYVLQEGWQSASGWVSHTPEGLSIDAQTGLISGTTEESGEFRMRVYAYNGAAEEVGIGVPVVLRINVSGAPVVTTSSVPDGVVGQGFEASLEAQSDFDVSWSWQAAEGSQLPPGLNLEVAEGDSKKTAITGTCQQRGQYVFDVTAENYLGATTTRFKMAVRQSMDDVQISPIADVVYTGSALEPKVVVTVADEQATAASGSEQGLVAATLSTVLTEGVDYEVAYLDNVNAGTATAVVEGKGLFQGMAQRTFTIKKAAQPLVAKAAKKSFAVKYAKLKKKKVTTAKTVKAQGAQGAVTYAKVKVNKAKFAKKFTVNKKTGKITVKKGTKKGTYKVTVKVTAAGNANYESGSRNVVVKVVVK